MRLFLHSNAGGESDVSASLARMSVGENSQGREILKFFFLNLLRIIFFVYVKIFILDNVNITIIQL